MLSYECLAVCYHVELCRPSLHCRPILSGVYAFRCILSCQVKLCLPCFVLSFHVELYVPRFHGDMLSLYASLCNVASSQAAVYNCRFLCPTQQQVAWIDSLKNAVAWRRRKLVLHALLKPNADILHPTRVEQERNGCLCRACGR